jgi:hypothetical protein
MKPRFAASFEMQAYACSSSDNGEAVTRGRGEGAPEFVIGRDWIVNSENRAVLYLKPEPLGLLSIAGSLGPPRPESRRNFLEKRIRLRV